MRAVVVAAVCASALLAAAQIHASWTGDAPDPTEIARLAIGKLMKQPYSTPFWQWEYGPAICMSAAYQISKDFGQNWTRALGTRLDEWLTNTTSPAYLFLHNDTLPWSYAVGDTNGLMPIAFLSRFDYFNEDPATSLDWQLSIAIAENWVMRWPKRLPDGIFSRDAGWPGQPDNNASFLWSDDQFMGLTVIARLASHGAPNAQTYLQTAAQMQLNYASFMQDPATGLFYHGYNFATNETSCCLWGRANGWVAMAHIEVLSALQAVAPNHPLFAPLLAVYKRHMQALVAVQAQGDGRWHQLVNETSTFLETSATAMNVFALAAGVTHGWLDKSQYDAAIQAGWAAVAAQVESDGTVNGICAGTGVLTSVAAYNSRPTDYAECQPGLGAVFRAAHAYYLYSTTA